MFIPKPDIRFYPPQEAMLDEIQNTPLEALSKDPSITDVEMRLKEIFIFDNREFLGKGEVYFITVVTDNLSEEPFRVAFESYRDIEDNQELPLGPSGVTIYRNPAGKIPRFIDYRIMVIESDAGIRSAGEFMEKIMDSEAYKTAKNIIINASAGGNVLVGGIVNVAVDILFRGISEVLKMNSDDQIIYIAGSFNDKLDDLGIKYGLIKENNRYARVVYQVEAA